MHTLNKKRVPEIDILRGIAVILMIIYHFFYDSFLFNYVQIDFRNNPFWYALPRIIVFLFLFCCGFSLYLAHSPTIQWQKFLIRLLKIAFFASVVSGVTYFLFPKRWIYFGTLHCILFSSVVTLPFIYLPWPSLILGLGLLLPSALFDLNLPWLHLPHQSMDYISPFPWMGVVLVGIFASYKLRNLISMQDKYNNKNVIRGIRYLGRHSLTIYILHQPIIFGTMFIISRYT